MNPKVDAWMAAAGKWQKEMTQLRSIALACGLTEELKWSKPCYCHQNKNIVVIQGFKAYCAYLFFKGYLLRDTDNILVKTGENTTVGRQIRFTDAKEIVKLAPVLKRYIFQAIEVEKSGTSPAKSEKNQLQPVKELKDLFTKNKAFKKAFESLTPGRQRAYHIYFSQAKQSPTRLSRIEKYMQKILDGKGMND